MGPFLRFDVSVLVMSDSATPWTIAYQASLSMEFSRQEYWSGLPCPLQGDLPNPGIKPRSLALQADSLPSEPPGKPVLNVLNDCFLKVHQGSLYLMYLMIAF